MGQLRSQGYGNYILLADDDDDDRYLMQAIFSENGYRNLILNSGLAALDYLQSLCPERYPALVLLDYTMPLLNGGQTLTQLKASENLKHLPVIVYSSEMNEALAFHLEKLGAVSCFSKECLSSEWNKVKHIIEAFLFREPEMSFRQCPATMFR